jgi:ribosomal protein S18 acetylase RimI-like enzyme
MLSDTCIIDSQELRKNAYSCLQVYRFLSVLQNDYPSFNFWYFAKVLPGIMRGSRFIIIKKVGVDLAGIIIVKKDDNEKKICTLRVLDKFSGKGIASNLLVHAFAILETQQPLISVAETRARIFLPIFDKYGFQLYKRYPSFYHPGISELSFNGFLNEKNNVTAITCMCNYARAESLFGTKKNINVLN